MPDGDLCAALRGRLDGALAARRLDGLHGVLVSHRGRVVLEHYGAGRDEAWGMPLGEVVFGPETLHDLRSVTKSVAGLLYGMALDRGLVPPPGAPLLAAFDYPDLAADPARAALTVGQALAMTLGLAWDEGRPYTDPLNSEIAMENAADRYSFVLGQPAVAAPGTRWIYSGGAVALVGALVERGSGRTLRDFARDVLFAPLGIADFTWATGRDGVASAASGLRLRPRDLLAIGRMVLDQGRVGGREIVSSGWLDSSFTSRASVGGGLSYGYLWYMGDAEAGPAGPKRWVAGFGNGGQRL